MDGDRISISPLALFDPLGTPRAPVVIDVRIDVYAQDDPHFLPTAWACPHLNIETELTEVMNKDVVVYCKGGLKLSMGAVAILRSHNVRGRFLVGGQDGWRAEGLPLVSNTVIAGSDLIVLPDDPTPTELGTMWLIRRFIAPRSRIISGDRDHVSAIAEKFHGTAIKGDTCFDDAIALFSLASPTLTALAQRLMQNDARFVPLCHIIATGYVENTDRVAAALSLFDTAFLYVRSTVK